MIKRLLISLTVIISMIFVSGASVSAFSPTGDACSSGQNTSEVCSNNSTGNPVYGPNGVLDKIINLVSIIVGIVAVFAIVLAGFMYITSGGDSQRINNAKNAIIYAIVGVLVVLIAQSVEIFIINNVGTKL